MYSARQRAAQRAMEHADVRPHLAALMILQDAAEIVPCVQYGTRYLTAWCRRVGEPARPDACLCAAADALALVYWSNAVRGDGIVNGHPRHGVRVAPARRARQLGVRCADFTMLRTVAKCAYRRRFVEALLSGIVSTRKSVCW